MGIFATMIGAPRASAAMAELPLGAFALVALAVLATATFIEVVRRLRTARLVGEDVSTIVRRLDRIAMGIFERSESPLRTSEVEQIDSALDTMAEQMRARIEVLQDAAQRDALTGMENRAHFEREVERRLDERTADSLACLMFIDIDGFKDVNDTLGHNLGDRLLQCVAERLKIATRLDEVLAEDDRAPGGEEVRIARFGGDEFVIFMSGLASDQPARKIANRILRVMVEPFELGGSVAGISASIGMAFVPGAANDYSDLLRAADTAMYHAKRSGGNRIEHFSSKLDAELHHKVALERDLREALASNQFELYYQPLFDCRTLKISSAEALIRWRHPQRGLVSPAEFIPIAERSNLICDIGEWVVGKAARTISRLELQGLQLRISVNVSPQQLEQMDFVSLVKSSLIRSNATPSLLEVEITESLAMSDAEMAADRLGRLADLGVSIAIDDFGTGYSNLASLIRLPVSRLKIDRSLLADFSTRREARTLVQTIINMANGLGFHSVTEGVENAEQLELLCAMGCEVVQGYYLSRPIDEQALEQLLIEAIPPDEDFSAFTAIAC